MSNVAIIGGDKRMLFCASSFLKDGFNVIVAGFDKLKSDCDIQVYPIEQAIACCDFVVLPLPCVKGKGINAPFSKEELYLTEDIISLLKEKKIFCGMKDKLLQLAPQLKNEDIFDYSLREEFSIDNAVATAEGAVEIAMREFEGTISHSKCLVCGYGRIGRALTDILCGLNADVTVSARKPSDLAWINTTKAKAVFTKDLAALLPFDIIFNTIPAMVLDSKVLSHIAKEALVIDLASLPGGIDFEWADRLGISTIHALSLPAKAAPKTAGELIKNTIINILEEDDGCQVFA